MQGGVNDFEDDDRVVAVVFMDMHDLAFQVGRQISQDWGASFALRERLAVQGCGVGSGASKEFLSEMFLTAVENVESGDAAFPQAGEKRAVPTDGGHDQRRLEGSLRNPSDRCCSGPAAVAGGEHIHAVGEEPESFLFCLGIHSDSAI